MRAHEALLRAVVRRLRVSWVNCRLDIPLVHISLRGVACRC